MVRETGPPGDAGSGDGGKPVRPRPVPLPPGVASPPGLPPPAGGARPAPRPLPLSPQAPARPASPPLPHAAQPPATQPSSAPAPRPLAAQGPRPIPLSGEAPAAVRTAAEEHSTPEERLKQWAFEFSPPMLISMCVHLVALVILALWILHEPPSEHIQLQASYAEEIGEQLDDDRFHLKVEPDQVVQSELDVMLPMVDDPLSALPDMVLDNSGDMAFAMIEAPTMGVSLSGRESGMKGALLSTFGGNQLSEKAVQAGLEWLVRNQRPNGSWSLLGPYSDGVVLDNPEAATAMALLALQGAGNTHHDGQFKASVAKGVAYLLEQQDAEGNFFRKGSHNHPLYTHAQCTMAMCDLFAMTHDGTLRKPAEAAVQYCVDSQDPDLGGWKYVPRAGADTSVTGWMVMALQTARFGKLNVPDETWQLVEHFLDRAQVDGGPGYGYHVDEPTPLLVMTAEALLCRQYLGWPHDEPRLQAGVKIVLEHLPELRNRDVYYWYYATQLMHHMEGQPWEIWNTAMRDLLIESQVKAGKERGSWDPKGQSPDLWANRDEGGRLYVTCFSLYSLEVYYRHLPIYSDLKKRLDAASR